MLNQGSGKAILNIATYGKQLCPTKDENAEEKIKTIVLPPFEYRLGLELALLAIKENIAKSSTCVRGEASQCIREPSSTRSISIQSNGHA
jgi:hypothetical protein